jgi:L-lactate dehydrogenase complex protein LldE
MQVELFIPCFIDQVKPSIAFDMIKVLEKAGCNVLYNVEQTCCGQPAYSAGYMADAREVAEKFVQEFPLGDPDRPTAKPIEKPIISPSASCVGMVKNHYNSIFQNTSLHNQCRKVQKNMFELSDFLVNQLQKTDLECRFDAKVTYHDSCSALRELRIKDAPRVLLNNIKGLQLIEMKDTETCCGFGGSFSFKYEPLSVSMGQQKVEHALATGAEYIVSTDYSCLMHLDAYIKKNNLNIQVLHLAELLAKGIQ